jgi:hypothetical protein
MCVDFSVTLDGPEGNRVVSCEHSRTQLSSGSNHATFKSPNQRIHNSAPVVTWRSMRLADGGLECLRRRIVDVIDVASGIHAGSARGVTATRCHDLVLFRLKLRNGDDDHHRRCGWLSHL